MKESGINYFIGYTALNTGLLKVMYTFEEGAGTTINSISGGQSLYAGTLNTSAGFWAKPGSGFFNGNYVTVSNASGLDSVAFTHLFVYEKTAPGGGLLLSTSGASGYRIGLTESNKVYFEDDQGANGSRVCAASYNNMGAKNLVSVSYATNAVSIGLYNWNARAFETETFNYPFGNPRSDVWHLGKTFTGYMDYYLYFNDYMSPSLLNSIVTGLYRVPTGRAYVTETVCSTGITGFQSVTKYNTGILGYTATASGGGEGVGDFTGEFPNAGNVVPVTGILSAATYLSGVTGVSCITTTGGYIDLLQTLTGYMTSFGMDKTLILKNVATGDIMKLSHSRGFHDDTYNKTSTAIFSGYSLGAAYPSGQFNLFMNGVAQANSGFSLTGAFLFVSGSSLSDIITFDVRSGSKVMDSAPPYTLSFTGQEIFLNGVNLISGYDFTYDGTNITLVGNNIGITGAVFEYPIGLPYVTGNTSIYTDSRFLRNTSNAYMNGIRQLNKVDYIEGTVYDLLSGNAFNENGNTSIYDDNGHYWE